MLSNLALLIFMAGIVAGGVLCTAGLASPGWFNLCSPDQKNCDMKGIWSCLKVTDQSNPCKTIWDRSGNYMQATIALTVVGILVAIAALVWSCIVCFACCFKTCLGPPLPALAFVAFALQLSACIIYGVEVSTVKWDSSIVKDPVQKLGYAYILTIVGAVVYFIDIFLGGLVVMCGGL